MNTPFQMDFQKETGIPRWGCFLISIYFGACLFLKKTPSRGGFLEVYLKGRETLTKKGDSLIEVGNKRSDYQLWCHDPGGFLQVCLDFLTPEKYIGLQTGDEERYYPWREKVDQKWTFLVDYWKRPKGEHCTCLYQSLGVTLDPMENRLPLEPHKRFRRFYIKERKT